MGVFDFCLFYHQTTQEQVSFFWKVTRADVLIHCTINHSIIYYHSLCSAGQPAISEGFPQVSQYFKSCLHQSWATASQNVCRRWIYNSAREKLNKYKKGWKVLAKLFPVLGVITEWLYFPPINWALFRNEIQSFESKWVLVFLYREYDQIFLSSPVWIL